MPNDGTNQSVGYITSVLHTASMRQEFAYPKDPVCCVTIVWVSIESTSSYEVKKCITLLSSSHRLYSSALRIGFTRRTQKTKSSVRKVVNTEGTLVTDPKNVMHDI